MADEDLLNAAAWLVNGLQSVMVPGYLLRTGNMQRSVMIYQIGENFIDVVIAVDYASYTNEGNKKTSGWLETHVPRIMRAYADHVRDKSTDGEAFGTDKGRKEDED